MSEIFHKISMIGFDAMAELEIDDNHKEAFRITRPLLDAAPELLDALEFLLREYERRAEPEVYASCEAVAQSDDAIKKARGE